MPFATALRQTKRYGDWVPQIYTCITLVSIVIKSTKYMFVSRMDQSGSNLTLKLQS